MHWRISREKEKNLSYPASTVHRLDILFTLNIHKMNNEWWEFFLNDNKCLKVDVHDLLLIGLLLYSIKLHSCIFLYDILNNFNFLECKCIKS